MKSDVYVQGGTLLLSVPQMQDPNFMHSVVLICEHTDKGAYGLVVNQKTELSIDELSPDHPLISKIECSVWSGGPVGRDALQFLHQAPNHIPGGVEIAKGLFLGGELEGLAQTLASDDLCSDVKLFLGYSGWGPGQLEGELGFGSWVPSPLDLGVVFGSASAESAWRRALRALGDEGEGLAQLPPDVSWN